METSHATVSVILPTYNGERTVARTIRSVLAQTFSNFELIIIDDNSSDTTRNIISSFTDQRIQTIFLDSNMGGPAIPRTQGCKIARGDFIAFIDQDDLFFPEYIAKKLQFFKDHPHITILSGFSWVFDLDTRKFIDCATFVPLNLMMKKDVLVSGQFFKADQNGVDEIGLLIRDTQQKKTKTHIAIYTEPLTIYNRHRKQNSHIDLIHNKIFIQRIQSLLNDLSDTTLFPEDAVSLYSRLGNFYSRTGDLSMGRCYFKKALRVKFSIFSLLLYFISFFGTRVYLVIESLLRFIQRTLLWRFRLYTFRIRFPESFNIFKSIIQKYEA
ncbi:MAG: glycosyltransferase family A protein [Candidatus Paceibacterota bacterium]